jgi:hypothetical protein
MKHSSSFLLSTFLQRWALHPPQALCLTFPRSSMLFISWELSPALEMEWAGNEVKEVGERRCGGGVGGKYVGGENFGAEKGLKNPWAEE